MTDIIDLSNGDIDLLSDATSRGGSHVIMMADGSSSQQRETFDQAIKYCSISLIS